MAYSAGNLELSIQTISKSTISSLDTLIQRLTTINGLMGKLPSVTKQLNKLSNVDVSGGSSKKGGKSQDLSKTLSLGKVLGKLYFIRNYTKQIGQRNAQIVQYGIDYTETMNLWTVAIRNNRAEAEEFVTQMAKAYGFATTTLMQYQATFKNMLSALGGISDAVSYQLSEFLVQMASDFASLYNTSIERAMTVFQSILSGQVRPVRSISGYDITETTIYQLYQQLGGSKTMRQLTQTEKRLLRIYAVFQQMESSGAIGDLEKTLGNSANQIRIFNEQLKELQTWLGNLFNIWLQPILPYINAIVIGLTRITKALALAMGYKNFEGAIDGVQTVNEELDETTGKLLSFDKFEALNSAGGGDALGLGIDESLINGLSQYNSILDSVTNKAQELAEQWFGWMFDEDGELTTGGKIVAGILESIVVSLGLISGSAILTGIKKLSGILLGLGKDAEWSAIRFKLLKTILISGIIVSITKAIDAFKEGDIWAGIFATAIGVTLSGAFIYANRVAIAGFLKTIGKSFFTLLLNATLATGSFALGITSLSFAFVGLSAALAGIILLFNNWDIMNNWQQIVAVIGVITTAVFGLAMAFGAFHSAWSIGVAAAAIIAGIGAIAASIGTAKSSVNARATGGSLYEDGLFTVSRGELMGKFDDGTSVVANNMQIIDGIKQGVYEAVTSANMQSGGGAGKIDIYLDKTKVGQGVAQSANKEMRRVGLLKANI